MYFNIANLAVRNGVYLFYNCIPQLASLQYMPKTFHILLSKNTQIAWTLEHTADSSQKGKSILNCHHYWADYLLLALITLHKLT